MIDLVVRLLEPLSILLAYLGLAFLRFSTPRKPGSSTVTPPTSPDVSPIASNKKRKPNTTGKVAEEKSTTRPRNHTRPKVVALYIFCVGFLLSYGVAPRVLNALFGYGIITSQTLPFVPSPPLADLAWAISLGHLPHSVGKIAAFLGWTRFQRGYRRLFGHDVWWLPPGGPWKLWNVVVLLLVDPVLILEPLVAIYHTLFWFGGLFFSWNAPHQGPSARVSQLLGTIFGAVAGGSGSLSANILLCLLLTFCTAGVLLLWQRWARVDFSHLTFKKTRFANLVWIGFFNGYVEEVIFRGLFSDRLYWHFRTYSNYGGGNPSLKGPIAIFSPGPSTPSYLEDIASAVGPTEVLEMLSKLAITTIPVLGAFKIASLLCGEDEQGNPCVGTELVDRMHV